MIDSGKRVRGGVSPFVVVVVLLVVALGVEAFLLLWPSFSSSRRPSDAVEAMKHGPSEIEYFGDESAPIKVELYAPLVLEWHQKTIALLRAYNEEHPGRIYVKLMPMGKSECDQEMEQRGYACAVLFINGKTEFTLPDGRDVMLEKKPNFADSFYNSEDAITIIDELSGGADKTEGE